MKKLALVAGLAITLSGCAIQATPEEMAELSQQLNSMGQSYRQHSQQMLQQASSFQAPAPAFDLYTQPKSYIYCNQNGYVTTCR